MKVAEDMPGGEGDGVRMKTRNLAITSPILLNACATRQTILTVPAVSMTRPSVDPNHVTQPSDKLSAGYCEGSDAVTSGENGAGLIDEAVTEAQCHSGAEYPSVVTISQKGDCMVVEGVAMK
jgi:hypothetical protein